MNNQNMHGMQNDYQYQQQYPQQQQYQQANFSAVNPQSFDPKLKNQLVNQNIYHAGYGSYKVCLVQNSVKFPYKNSYHPGAINSVCKVLVHHKHTLDVADSLSDHGVNSITSNKPIPAIMYPMGKEFIGTNYESREGIYDENIILRTNYAYVIKRQTDIFNAKENQRFVVYSNPITAIRDKNYNPLPYDNVFKMGVITVCMGRQKDLLIEEPNPKSKDDKDKGKEKKIEPKKMLSSDDMLLLQMYVENVFQAAICGYHNILLLPVFGKEFGIPIEDQLIIYNLCIMKFGHMFKAVMICVPSYESKDLFEFLDRSIIKPHEITKDIDMKYMAENMSKRLHDDATESNDDRFSNKVLQKENITKKMASMTDEERMKMLRKMVKSKKNSNQKSIKKSH